MSSHASRRLEATFTIAVALASFPAHAARSTDPYRHVEDGVVVTFSLSRPGGAPAGARLQEGDEAEVRFRLTDASTGAPLRGVNPSAWMERGDGERSCLEKIPLYLRGLVGLRPMVDLNSYFVLVLNQDPTISVIDPLVGMTGRTSLAATILLESPGADWVISRDGRLLFVSMPRANKVAVVDAATFRVKASLPAGVSPTRVALQPDGRLLWVGNNARDDASSGVTVIDTDSLEVLGFVRTGRGHHELAFSADDRHAFVTNRNSGTLSVVDVGRREVLGQVAVGAMPLSVAVSRLSGRAYVADGKGGRVAVVDPVTRTVVKRIELAAGLGPLRFSDDGRWGFALNSLEHDVAVLDAATDRIAHRIPVGGQPYQVTLSRAYAYVRLLDSENVAMLPLAPLARGEPPTVKHFAAGEKPPSRASELSIADSISRAATEAAVFVVNPADNLTYFYMEGMNATAGSFMNYGHSARAVTLADRSLREVEPGVYAASLRLPASGQFDVAFLLDAPRLSHCFAATVDVNPALERERKRMTLEYLPLPERIVAGREVKIRFRLKSTVDATQAGAEGVRVLSYLAPGRERTELPVKHVEQGLYEVKATFSKAGAWYLHVLLPSQGSEERALPYRTVRVWDAPAKR